MADRYTLAMLYTLSMNATMRLRIAASGKRPMLAVMLSTRCCGFPVAE